MGFWDSFEAGKKDGLKNGRKSNQRMNEQIRHRESRERSHIASIRAKSDASLMKDYSSSYTSDEDKQTIMSILIQRGYSYLGNGKWNR